MSFFSKKSTEKNHLVCVITSYAAIASVVRMYHGEGATGHPVVLFSHFEMIENRHGRNVAMLNESACQAMARAIGVCKKSRPDFDQLICAIGEPWITTMSRSVHLEKKDPLLVTKKIIDDLVSRDKKLFEIDIARDFPGRDIELVQSSRPVVWINGYQVVHPLGTQAATIDVSVMYSIADGGFVDELSGVFIDAFHRENVSFISTDIAQMRGVPETTNRVMVNLGGSTSNISIIDRGRSTYHISIPAGLHDIEHSIAQEFGVTKSGIASVMKFASDEKLLAHERDDYYRRIEKSYAFLGEMIRRAGMELKRHIGMLPSTGYVSGIPEWITVLSPLLEKDLEIELSPIPAGNVVYTQNARGSDLLTSVILATVLK